jgi:RNA processing factor Prp31
VWHSLSLVLLLFSSCEGLTGPAAAKAQLGLGHSYSRTKVKFNVNRVDNMVIQGISLLDQVDKDINTFSMRIREWYSYHFPELVKVVPDNYMYARVANFVGARSTLTEEKRDTLEEIVQDSAKVAAIFDAAKVSMGMDISPVDLLNIEHFTTRVISLADYRRQLMEYLSGKMMDIAPNLTTLIGEQVGARLISHAGSLTNLAKYPASTVQILGAEKALFRALKTRGNTPKYGLIFHSSFIGRAGSKNKGRISRYLANKCSIAARIDSFSEQPSSVFGEKLKDQVEERLKFYETGTTPRKNVDVMKEAIAEAKSVLKDMEVDLPESAPTSEKKKKKKKKKAQPADESEAIFLTSNGAEEMDTEAVMKSPKKKKKKHNKSADVED